MNQVEVNRKETRGLIITSSQRNSIKCTSQEHTLHRHTKYKLAEYCYENELEFFTECEMKSGGRADFIISDWNLILEVYRTEKKESLLLKAAKYPQGLGFIPLKAGTDTEIIWKMLDDLSSTNGNTWKYYYDKWVGENEVKL